MSDTDTENPEAGATLAETDEEQPFKLSLQVDIKNSGPCRKHVRLTVPRGDLDHFRNDAIKDLLTNAAVPGFRTGHVPRALVEKKFKKELGDQVRQKVLLQSLQQLGEDHKLDAINEPDLDVDSLEIPAEGDFTYEFDVEVRPEFELPNYAGLKIRRPVREVTEDDLQNYLEKYLSQFGQLVPHDGPAEAGDYVLANLLFESNGKELSRRAEQQIRIRPVLRFTDAEVAGFDKLMAGAQPGDVREAVSTISVEAPHAELRGEPLKLTFEVLDVKRLRLPELTPDFLEQLSVASDEELRKEIREMLDRQVKFEQRQATREQVLAQITASADWDLPETLVRRQVENALRRETLEMQQAGYTDEEIRARQNALLQQQISTTRQALKQHFVLDKISTQEKLQVTPQDKEIEIAFMAMQRGESPRKVRARLEKQGLMENLEAQILERKAVDVVLEKAEFQDVPAAPIVAGNIEAIDVSVCGQPVEPAPAEAASPG
ncbi:MAG: trigger factor [Planctomycetaceae bacterium]